MVAFSHFAKSSFTNHPYVKRIEKPWGYEIHFVKEGKPYMGKILHVAANKRLSLQVHDQKQESWFLLKGRAKVAWDNNKGELVETELLRGFGYSCEVGQRHRLVGITDCDIVEVSTPEIGTTYRLEDDYNRKDETGEIRKKERNKKNILWQK
jgi:mannose-6-phosphate isomerase-like protein (cupin superfamily)